MYGRSMVFCVIYHIVTDVMTGGNRMKAITLEDGCDVSAWPYRTSHFPHSRFRLNPMDHQHCIVESG